MIEDYAVIKPGSDMYVKAKVSGVIIKESGQVKYCVENECNEYPWFVDLDNTAVSGLRSISTDDLIAELKSRNVIDKF